MTDIAVARRVRRCAARRAARRPTATTARCRSPRPRGRSRCRRSCTCATVCAHVQTPPLDDIGGVLRYRLQRPPRERRRRRPVRACATACRSTARSTRRTSRSRSSRCRTARRCSTTAAARGCRCARVLAARPDLDGAVFDVSDAYRAAWDAFVPRDESSGVRRRPPSWAGRFDAVLSFFALEHVGDPRAFLAGDPRAAPAGRRRCT